MTGAIDDHLPAIEDRIELAESGLDVRSDVFLITDGNVTYGKVILQNNVSVIALGMEEAKLVFVNHICRHRVLFRNRISHENTAFKSHIHFGFERCSQFFGCVNPIIHLEAAVTGIERR